MVSSQDYKTRHQKLALEIYEKTIAMRTAAGHNQVKVMAHYLADRFRDGGFDDNNINIIPFISPNGEEIASLIVRFRGDNTSNKKPILFVAHMDVVDALKKDWVKRSIQTNRRRWVFFWKRNS